MTTIKTRIARALSQPTTWRGIVLIATAIGANLNPELQEAIVSLGLLIVGVFLVSDDTPPPKK
jgi:hypothetical protein